MQTYISILRGINVSGHKKIAMADLKKLYEGLGFDEVRTYIQSGNVIFRTAKKADQEKLAGQITQAIRKQYDFEVPVIVLSKAELENAVANNPFEKEQGVDVDKTYITFLAEKPGKPALDKLKDLDFSPDRFIVSGEEIYVYCPGGYGNTKLNNNFFEAKLKIPATTRNWKTVNQLLQLAAD